MRTLPISCSAREAPAPYVGHQSAKSAAGLTPEGLRARLPSVNLHLGSLRAVPDLQGNCLGRLYLCLWTVCSLSPCPEDGLTIHGQDDVSSHRDLRAPKVGGPGLRPGDRPCPPDLRGRRRRPPRRGPPGRASRVRALCRSRIFQGRDERFCRYYRVARARLWRCRSGTAKPMPPAWAVPFWLLAT